MIGVSDTRSATARGSLGSNLGASDYFPQYFPPTFVFVRPFDVRFRTSNGCPVWTSYGEDIWTFYDG